MDLEEKALIEREINYISIKLVEVRPPGCKTTVWKIEFDEGDWDAQWLKIWFTNFEKAAQIFENICRYGFFDEDKALSKAFTTAQIEEKEKLERVCGTQDLNKIDADRIDRAQREGHRNRREAVRNAALPRDRARVITLAPSEE